MTNTINNVPRELLAELQEHIQCHHDAVLWGKVCDLLSAPSPAGGGGLEVVAWRIGFPNNAGYKVYEQRQPWAYERYGVPLVIVYEVQELCRLSDAQAIIDGLRGEVERLQFSLEVAKTDELSAAVYAETESIKHSLRDAEKERYKQAQRIGELEGLLRACHSALYPFDNKMLEAKIDAALSAGKEGE